LRRHSALLCASALPGSTGEALTALRDDIEAMEGYPVTRALIPGMIVYAVMACATC